MKSLRRVLIVHPYGIGDLLFVTPVLRALRLIPSVEKVDMLLGSRTDVVVRANPHVDEIFSIDKDLFHRQTPLRNLREMYRLGTTLRKNRYDLMIDYSLRREYAFWARTYLGIRRSAGFDYKGRGCFHHLRLPLPDGFSGKHVTEYYCDLAEAAGVTVEDRWMEFYLSEEVRREARGLVAGRKILTVSPGGGDSWGKDAHFKRWPVAYFSDLIRRISGEVRIDEVFILGSPSEKPLAQELRALLNLPARDLTGEIGLELAAAVMKESVLFVGNDGGLVHMARALETPLIAFYGPVDPAVYGPYPVSAAAAALFKDGLGCRPCYRKFRYDSSCRHLRCLTDLTPEEVMAQLKKNRFFENSLQRERL